ncbi:MAG: HEAT repeat domain-containing protein, partial [Myxococcales bacterium]
MSAGTSSELVHPDPEVRYRALLELEPPQLELLLARLSDESWRVRRAAVERLVSLPDRAAAVEPLLMKLADGDDAGARNAAAEALTRLGRAALPGLQARLRDPDVDVRKFACDVLGEIGDGGAVPALVQALEDGDCNVRAAAAEALGKLGGPEACAALERQLGEPHDPLVTAALDGLARLRHAPPLATLLP